MFILILVVVFGLFFSFFATSNTTPVDISFWKYSLTVPLYLVVLASLAAGLITSGLIYLIKSLSSSLTIGEKDSELKQTKEELAEVTKEAHKLELENTKLKSELGEKDDDDSI